MYASRSISAVSQTVVQSHNYQGYQEIHRSISQQQLTYGHGAHPQITYNPVFNPEEAIQYQPQAIGGPTIPSTNLALEYGGYGHPNEGYVQNEPYTPTGMSGRGQCRPDQGERQPESIGKPPESKKKGIPVCTILKRICSALLIIGDVFIDWTSLADVITGTTSAGKSLTNNKTFDFSFPTFDKAMSVINNNLTKDMECSSKTYNTYYLTYSYGSFVLFGTLFTIVKLLNIIGETIREIGERNQKRKTNSKKSKEKKLKSVGFQIIHGWVETVLALLFEDLPQNVTVLLYSFTCKSKALNAPKVLVSMIGSSVKNIVRKSTCKQKSAFVCCLYRYDIGCMDCTCCSIICCSCCNSAQNFYPNGSLIGTHKPKPIEDVDESCLCCEYVNLEWGYETHFPPVCSCGRFICIKQMGCCIDQFEERACCKLDCYGCCGKRIDKDPIWLEKYISLMQLGNFVIIILYIIKMFLEHLTGPMF